MLSEKIGEIDGESELVAHPEFCFVGTMNPGGDYGKKEVCFKNLIVIFYLHLTSINFLSYHQLFAID